MTITIEKVPFSNTIKAVKTACEKGKLQPVLNTIHIESVSGGLQLTATDCNNIAKAVVEANNSNNEKVDICVNADKLENIISRLDNLIKLDIEETNIIIKSGKTKFNCLYITGSEFPQNTEILFNEKNKIVLKKEDFINAINKVAYATAQDTTGNIIISGICMTLNKGIGYEFAATDGNRLSQVVIESEDININGKYAIPKKILLDASKIIDKQVEISFNDNKTISLKTANYLFSSRLLNGDYPPYNQLIPEGQPITVRIKKDELLKAIDTVSIMANDRTNIITLLFKDNELNLSCNCADGEAEEKIEVEYKQDELKIAFNFRYLIEGLRAINGDDLTFNMNGSLNACLIKSDFNYLVMPIQLR